MDATLLPVISDSTAAFIAAAYGVLMLLTLLQALPEARRFFVSERWGGYAVSSPDIDRVQNPVVMPLLMALWIAAVLALIVGWGRLWPALINLALCRYFFVHMRWRGVLRGMGAPGFIAYWLGLAVFLLQLTTTAAPAVRSLALLVLQVDLALIMLSAGIYKATAGYPRNHGMELGLANPMWGYWWRRYLRVPPNHWVIWTLNQLAWGTEVVGAVLMLLPWTRELGGLLISGSFVFILTQIRLGFLCEMMVVAGLLYVTPGSLVDGWIAALSGAAITNAAGTAVGTPVGTGEIVLRTVLWAYLVLLPLAHAGLYFNFYAQRRLPAPLQWLLERYTNLFGLIIWRVFSVDLVNFFIRVDAQPRSVDLRTPAGARSVGLRAPTSARGGGPRTPVVRLGSWPRFNHVGEMICLTSLFTTLKYYPGNDAIFRQRLLRYARTLPHGVDSVLVFAYSRVVKRPDRFDWELAAEYRVDVVAGTIDERLIDPTFSARAAHAASPVHAGAVPGSYAPAPR